MCVSGAFARARVLEPVAKAFGRIPRGAPVGCTSPGNGQTGPVVEFIKNPGSQTELRVALRSLGERDADYVTLVLLSRLLDDGMSTRLHRRICDEKGLAYEISAGLDTYDDVGLLDVAASVAPHKLVDVVAEILRLLKSLRDRAIDPEELDKAKRRYRWDLEATEDDIEGMAGWFGATELFHPPEPIEDRIRRIEAVTAEDLVRVADRVVAAKGLNVTVLGEVGRRDRARAERAVERTLR